MEPGVHPGGPDSHHRRPCPDGPLGPYQLQAAIAAVHAEAARAESTDWPQILALYAAPRTHRAGNPVVTLNRSVAVAMVQGPRAGLELLDTLDDDGRIAGASPLPRSPRTPARDGRRATRLPDRGYQAAARRTTSLPEKRYLEAREGRLVEEQ